MPKKRIENLRTEKADWRTLEANWNSSTKVISQKQNIQDPHAVENVINVQSKLGVSAAQVQVDENPTSQDEQHAVQAHILSELEKDASEWDSLMRQHENLIKSNVI